jgi:hypothetical protein
MPLWRKLYNTVWLAFFSCVLIPRWMTPVVGLPVHLLLGLAMLAMTQANRKALAAVPVPDRLKRVSKVTAGFVVVQLVSGAALGGIMHLAPHLHTLSSVVRGIHVVFALAILAQTSSVATGYDMWEEKELGPAPER